MCMKVKSYRLIFSGKLHNFHLNTCLWRLFLVLPVNLPVLFCLAWPL